MSHRTIRRSHSPQIDTLFDIPLVQVFNGNSVMLMVDRDEELRRRRERAKLMDAQQEQVQEVLRSRI